MFPSLNKVQQKLADINIAWCEYEKNMGENATLEVACQERGVDSQWFYDLFCEGNNADKVNEYCTWFWDKKINTPKECL